LDVSVAVLPVAACVSCPLRPRAGFDVGAATEVWLVDAMVELLGAFVLEGSELEDVELALLSSAIEANPAVNVRIWYTNI
jgi:hypothetical protein